VRREATSQTLRHALNSLQNAAGADETLRAILMGHTDSSRLTDVNYLTVWMANKQASANRMADLIAAKSATDRSRRSTGGSHLHLRSKDILRTNAPKSL
jgi:hypothetical protein